MAEQKKPSQDAAKISKAGAVEIEETDLDQAQGAGYHITPAWPTKISGGGGTKLPNQVKL